MFGLLKGWINSHFEGRVAVQQGAKTSRLNRERSTGRTSRNIDPIQFMSEGGFVRGGVENRDSVPAMLMPGEYVLSKSMVAGLSSLTSDIGAQGRGIQIPARSETNVVRNDIVNNNEFVIDVRTQQLPNKTETKKWVQATIVPALRQLQAGGF